MMRKLRAAVPLCALLLAGCCTLSEYEKCSVTIYQKNHPNAWKHKALEVDT